MPRARHVVGLGRALAPAYLHDAHRLSVGRWVIYDGEGGRRFAHEGGKYIPGAGYDWAHVHRTPHARRLRPGDLVSQPRFPSAPLDFYSDSKPASEGRAPLPWSKRGVRGVGVYVLSGIEIAEIAPRVCCHVSIVFSRCLHPFALFSFQGEVQRGRNFAGRPRSDGGHGLLGPAAA